MRTIKFRLVRTHSIVGFERITPDEDGNLHSYWSPDNSLGGWILSELPKHDRKDQFTGLFDSEGREIYEGDILLDDADGVAYDYVEWSEHFGGWSTGQWFTPRDLVKFSPLHEVAGNIHENPGLLASPIDSPLNAASDDSKVG